MRSRRQLIWRTDCPRRRIDCSARSADRPSVNAGRRSSSGAGFECVQSVEGEFQFFWGGLSVSIRIALAAVLVGFASCVVHAQNMHRVRQPHIPPSCVVLRARIAARNGVLPASAESHLDTQRIQSAIDHCGYGRAVELRSRGARQFFLTGPLTLHSGVTLLIDANTSLAASTNARLYDLTPGSCGVLGAHGRGCRPLISATHIRDSGVMGAGSIEGRGGDDLLGRHMTWWQLAHDAKVLDRYQKAPGLIALDHVHDFTLYGITLRDSPAFHVIVRDSSGFLAWDVKIMTPGTARNTDGIDPVSSRNVAIAHSYIHAGDDDVAISSNRAGPAEHISILDDHFYTGHGMSIGSGTSGGVSDVLVRNLSIDGAQNGIRIKSDRSRGGRVRDVRYENICITHVTNPIVLTSHYTDFSGKLIPEYRHITLKNVTIDTPGYYVFAGLGTRHRLGVTLENVFATGLSAQFMSAAHADVTFGPEEGNLVPHGADVRVAVAAGARGGTRRRCARQFVPFPSLASAPALKMRVPPIDKTLYVATDGTGDFYSIQRAIDVAPSTGAVISVAPGVYHEVLTITKPNILLRSPYRNAAKTIVVAGRGAATAGGTFRSATVNVLANNFTARNITFENDYNRRHPQVREGSQAIALRVEGDRDVFDNVRILGHQDTLFAATPHCLAGAAPHCAPARQFFDHCFIEGNVDFVFGDAKAVFDHCVILSNHHSVGFITAQSKKSPQQRSGFVFDHCRLGAKPGVGDVYLGRPWRPYATVVYLNTWMGPQIMPAGWREWHPGQTRSLRTAFFAEYRSSGPGAVEAQRERWAIRLTAQQAAEFAPARFLRGADGWNPMALRRHSPETP